MNDPDIQAGDNVRIVNIPDWLLCNLPAENQQRLLAQKGQAVKVPKLTPHGFLWLSFADGTEGFSLQPSDVELVARRLG